MSPQIFPYCCISSCISYFMWHNFLLLTREFLIQVFWWWIITADNEASVFICLRKTSFFFFWQCYAPCKLLVLPPGTEPGPSAVKVWGPTTGWPGKSLSSSLKNIFTRFRILGLQGTVCHCFEASIPILSSVIISVRRQWVFSSRCFKFLQTLSLV